MESPDSVSFKHSIQEPSIQEHLIQEHLIQEHLLQEQHFSSYNIISEKSASSHNIISENQCLPTILFLKISYQLSSFYFTVLNLEHKTSLIVIDLFGNFRYQTFILVWDFYSCLGLLSFHQAGLTDKFPSKESLLAVKTCFRNRFKSQKLLQTRI